MKQRINYIDRMKGMAILLVVMGHLYFFSYGQSDSIVFCFISSFHMPLFMFLSGLVSSPSLSLMCCVKKILRLLLPMLFFGLCFTVSFSQINAIEELGLLFISFIQKASKNGYWYLMSLSLFYISLQFFRLNRCNSIIKDALIALVTYLIFFIGWKLTAQVIDPLCLLNSTDFYPFFILGYFASKYNWIEYFNTHNWLFTMALVGYLIFFDRQFPIHIVDSISERFIVRLCAIIVITMLFAEREKEDSVVEHALAYIGRNTLDIYVLHYFFVNSINLVIVDKWLQSTGNTPLSFVVSLLLAIPITYVSIGLGYILHKSKILNKIAYGKF
ncbi:acyltransferase family protein [uncultured Bacteroides sp.]|uniref:acyltransferase family protein n=1 Tax=uncultured Bacteroides sp. TaxID=162156 RepID=UPI002582A4CD|nr:acyltransferase family protein [uncultured Bacteroides sp.]